MRVELSPFVEQDLQNIADYIALHNPTRALSFVEELERAIQHIAENPLVYRLRPDAGRGTRRAGRNIRPLPRFVSDNGGRCVYRACCQRSARSFEA